MVVSGIVISQEVKDTIHKINKKKMRGAIFRVSDDKKSVIIDTSMPLIEDAKENAYETIMQYLDDTKPCYAYCDTEITSPEERIIQKTVLIAWAPDSASIKEKMIITTTVDTLKKECSSSPCIQINSSDDKTVSTVVSKLCEVSKCKAVTFEGRPLVCNQMGEFSYKDC